MAIVPSSDSFIFPLAAFTPRSSTFSGVTMASPASPRTGYGKPVHWSCMSLAAMRQV